MKRPRCAHFFTLLFIIHVQICDSFSQRTGVSDWKTNTLQKETVVRLLHHDSSSSSFLIYLKKGVNSHRHLKHHEVVTVLRGKASMTLGADTFLIRKGDVIVIPTGTFHSVRNLRRKPLIVLSVQSPYFDGSDREWEILDEK
jgi:mannose-6-phosphate isomerase-like protein (cupin superfamily)